MKEEDKNLPEEKFSDNIEENLRIENEILKFAFHPNIVMIKNNKNAWTNHHFIFTFRRNQSK